MVVINPLKDEDKLKLTISDARVLCKNRHMLFGENACIGDRAYSVCDTCDECMFHSNEGCKIEGEPRYWMSDTEEKWDIHSKNDALQMIIDLADDYDNANSVESLKSLIDELVEVAKCGRNI